MLLFEIIMIIILILNNKNFFNEEVNAFFIKKLLINYDVQQ